MQSCDEQNCTSQTSLDSPLSNGTALSMQSSTNETLNDQSNGEEIDLPSASTVNKDHCSLVDPCEQSTITKNRCLSPASADLCEEATVAKDTQADLCEDSTVKDTQAYLCEDSTVIQNHCLPPASAEESTVTKGYFLPPASVEELTVTKESDHCVLAEESTVTRESDHCLSPASADPCEESTVTKDTRINLCEDSTVTEEHCSSIVVCEEAAVTRDCCLSPAPVDHSSNSNPCSTMSLPIDIIVAPPIGTLSKNNKHSGFTAASNKLSYMDKKSTMTPLVIELPKTTSNYQTKLKQKRPKDGGVVRQIIDYKHGSKSKDRGSYVDCAGFSKSLSFFLCRSTEVYITQQLVYDNFNSPY